MSLLEMGFDDIIKYMIRTLTDQELTALLRTTRDHRAGWRDHYLYVIALRTGLREHELEDLDVGDVLDRQWIQLKTYKGQTEAPNAAEIHRQQVYLTARVCDKMRDYLAEKRRHAEDMSPGAPLFLGRGGGRISTSGIRRAFGRWQKRAGLERHHSFHEMRHTAISIVYEKTKDITQVMRFARHASLRTSLLYIHGRGDQAYTDALERFF